MGAANTLTVAAVGESVRPRHGRIILELFGLREPSRWRWQETTFGLRRPAYEGQILGSVTPIQIGIMCEALSAVVRRRLS